MKTIYLYLLNTLADWEIGYVMAELRSQRFFSSKRDWQVKTCALNLDPVVTMGGLTLRPDVTVDQIKPASTQLLILAGADIWFEPEQAAILKQAQTLLAAGTVVAAICGATGALAQAGMLDHVQHTSNGLQYLQMFCPNYKGANKYQEELAVTDGNLITAGSSAPVEFARHILAKLDVMTPDKLDHWYAYFARHSTPDLMKLLNPS